MVIMKPGDEIVNKFFGANLPPSNKLKILLQHCFRNKSWSLQERLRLRCLSQYYNQAFSDSLIVCSPAKLCRDELRAIRKAIPKLRILDLTGSEWRQLQLETADNLFRSKVITLKSGDQRQAWCNSPIDRYSHPSEITKELNEFESLEYVCFEGQQCSSNLNLSKLKGVNIIVTSPQQLAKFCKRHGVIVWQEKLRASVQIRNYNMTDSADRLALQSLRVWTTQKVDMELDMHGFLDDLEDDRLLMAQQWKMLREDFNLTSLKLRLSGACSVSPSDLSTLLEHQPALERLDISLDGACLETLNVWKAPIHSHTLTLLNNIPYFNLCVGNHIQLLKQIIKNGLTGLGGVSTSKAGDTPEGIDQIIKCIACKLPNLRCYRDEQFGVLGLNKVIHMEQMDALQNKLVKLHLHCFINKGAEVGKKLMSIIGQLTNLQVLELSCVTKLQNGNRQNYVLQTNLQELYKLTSLRCLQLKSIRYDSLLEEGGLEWLSSLEKLSYLDLSVGYGGGDDLVKLNKVGNKLYQECESRLKRVRCINLRVFPIGE